MRPEGIAGPLQPGAGGGAVQTGPGAPRSPLSSMVWGCQAGGGPGTHPNSARRARSQAHTKGLLCRNVKRKRALLRTQRDKSTARDILPKNTAWSQGRLRQQRPGPGGGPEDVSGLNRRERQGGWEGCQPVTERRGRGRGRHRGTERDRWAASEGADDASRRAAEGLAGAVFPKYDLPNGHLGAGRACASCSAEGVTGPKLPGAKGWSRGTSEGLPGDGGRVEKR